MIPFGVKLIVESNFDLFEIAPRLKTLCLKEKLVLIKGLPPLEKETFIELGLKISSQKEKPFIEWDFGSVMELKEDPSSPNYLFSNESVPFHWDGAFHETPSYLMFNCIEAPHSEGNTFFTDTEGVIKHLDREVLSVLSTITLEYRTEKKSHYGGLFKQAVMSVHPCTGNPILRYGEPVPTLKNPVEQRLLEPCPEKTRTLRLLQETLYNEQFCLRHQWQPGDLILADNYSLLHGREAFRSQEKRHLRRIQLR